MVRGLHRHDELKISRSKIVQYFKFATDQLKNKKNKRYPASWTFIFIGSNQEKSSNKQEK